MKRTVLLKNVLQAQSEIKLINICCNKTKAFITLGRYKLKENHFTSSGSLSVATKILLERVVKRNHWGKRDADCR